MAHLFRAEGSTACGVILIFLFCLQATSALVTPKLLSNSVDPAPPVFPLINPNGLLANATTFTLNGTQNYRILSGAIHYFRVPHQYWRDRLERLRALGANTVETYVAWNLHEPSPGNVDFKDDLDIRQFLQTAQAVGLNVILRPGPYICAEWEFGGLPSWLLLDPNMKARTSYAPFMAAVDAWFGKLFTEIQDLQYMHGGPIIAIQVENEYGNYGSDHEYEKAIGFTLIKHGATELLFTCDGDVGRWRGLVPGVMGALTGRDGMFNSLTSLRNRQPNLPLLVVEFWSGWFDTWGEPKHNIWTTDQYLQELRVPLEQFNASVNLYMAHGGTNFGFMAGAGLGGSSNDWKYSSVTTSYDYDAPIGEDGSLHPTKYNATRQLFAQYSTQPLPPLPQQPVRRAYGSVIPNGILPLYPESAPQQNTKLNSMLDFVTNVKSSSDIFAMELLANVNNGAGQQYGYILYRRDISDVPAAPAAHLTVNGGVRDRLTVTYSGVQQDTPFPKDMTIYQNDPVNITLTQNSSNTMLNILVENRGRIRTYDYFDNQRKGLQGTVELADAANLTNHILNNGWIIYPLDFNRDFMRSLLDDKNSGAFEPVASLTKQQFPAMLRYVVDLGAPENVADAFLYLPGMTIAKGVAFVNSRNLGRFWNVGPQKSLYIPKWYWNYETGGNNSIMIFAEDATPTTESGGDASDFTIELRDTPDLGPTAY